MGKARIGELIVLDVIEGDGLRERLAAVKPGISLELDVGGVSGRWERTAVEIEGRAIAALRALGAGRVAAIRQAAPNELATFGLRQLLWDTPESQIR